jgi:hypothetical protein
MDLSSLDSTLPPALADAERDMGDKFRGMSGSVPSIRRGVCLGVAAVSTSKGGGWKKGKMGCTRL